MARLAKLIGRSTVPPDEPGRIEIAIAAAEAFGQVVLLKGYRSVITDGKRIYINATGNSSLSKAGAGDVLSGVIGTLLAQEMDPFDAARLGAHLHGRAGEIAGERLGMRSVLAFDVVDALSSASGRRSRNQLLTKFKRGHRACGTAALGCGSGNHSRGRLCHTAWSKSLSA